MPESYSKHVLTRELTLDPTYDQSGIGPGSYEHQSSFPRQIDWALRHGKHQTNHRHDKPTYSFSLGNRVNEKVMISKQHLETERLLKESPSVTAYDPDLNLTRERLDKGLTIDRSPKLDEIGFLRMAKRSPSPGLYDVKDPREHAYTERFRAPITVRPQR